MPATKRTQVNPQKLLLSKWTALSPRNKEKHFIVSSLLTPENPASPLEFVELEAVLSKRLQVLPWRALTDASVWRQGWH